MRSNARYARGSEIKTLVSAGFCGVVLGFAALAAGASAAQPPRPNILWLTLEDVGPHLGCYGDRRPNGQRAGDR